MKIIRFLTIFIITTITTAQTNDSDNWSSLPNFNPKSPEAEAFERYGEYNVNLASGKPDLKLPLYTVEAGSYKLPITLNYQFGGIKSNQDATWVGLGWFLNAGAQITLDIRDTPDENVQGLLPDINNANTILSNVQDWDYCTPDFFELRRESWIKDVYHFNSPTANGKFIIGDSEGEENIHIYPPDAFKVEVTGGKLNRGFIITDIKGNRYYFSNTREISVSTNTPGAKRYTSAWYVDQIKTPTNNFINFYYTHDGWHGKENRNDKIVKSHTYNHCSRVTSMESIGSSTEIKIVNSTKTYKLSSIECNDTRILFQAQSGRLDLATPSLLGQAMYPDQNIVPSYLKYLQIQKKINDTYTYVRGYEFIYDYFDAGGIQIEYHRKRLKLKEVNDLIDPTISHKFTYSAVNLPLKNSRSMDAYGYCNGKANLTTIPLVYTYLNNGKISIGGANRKVEPIALQAGILTEVQYPTKGKTKFFYEPNQYYGVDFLSKYHSNIVNSNVIQGTGGNVPVKEKPGIDGMVCDNKNPLDCVNYVSIPYTAVNAEAMLTFKLNKPQGDNPTLLKYHYAKIRVISGGEELYNSGNLVGQDYSIPLQLPQSGTLEVEVYGQYYSIQNLQLNILNNDLNQKNTFGPGLRISEIHNYNDDLTLASKKKYTYTLPNDTSKSSGKFINLSGRMYDPETFKTFKSISCKIGATTPFAMWFETITTIFKGQSPFFLMNEVSYTHVKEENIDFSNSSNNGYTVYNFDFKNSDISRDGTIKIEFDWIRGNLLNKKIFNTNNQIISETTNNYTQDFSKISKISGFKLYTRLNFIDCPSINFPSPEAILYENMGYTYTIPWYYQKSTIFKENYYDAQNNLSGTITSTTIFNYDNPNHMQLSSEVLTNSLGNIVEKKYLYPGDSDISSQPYVTEMIYKNMIGTPIKTVTYKDNVKLSEQLTLYDQSPETSNLLLPKEIYSAKFPNVLSNITNIGNLEKKITFNQYDDKGNVLQYTPEGGTPVSIIWGYKQTKPIAKIENARYSQITAFIGNLQYLSDNETEDDLITALNSLRTNLPDAMVTTYTYKPLVGVSTITDAKGYTTTYLYDNFGRLGCVKDHNGNILSENQYNYKQ